MHKFGPKNFNRKLYISVLYYCIRCYARLRVRELYELAVSTQAPRAPRIFRQWAHESGKIVSRKHWSPLSLERLLIFILEAVSTPES